MKWDWLFRDRRTYRILMAIAFLVIPAILYLWLGMSKLNVIQAMLVIMGAVMVALLLMIGGRVYELYQKQESEIRMYQMYTKPLEELIREIRARQHEFNNHLNAILNLHLTVDNYEELVEAQSAYIHSVADDKRSRFLPLLKISDKILAGFLYTKLVSASELVDFTIEIGSSHIVSRAMEKDIIEVVGTLIDNAVDACNEKYHEVKLFVSSRGEDTPSPVDDCLIFEIMNEHPLVTVREMSQFFERGYSTKSEKGNRGLGLYNARRIIHENKGEITMDNFTEGDKNFLRFRIEI